MRWWRPGEGSEALSFISKWWPGSMCQVLPHMLSDPPRFLRRGNLPEVKLQNSQWSHLHLMTGTGTSEIKHSSPLDLCEGEFVLGRKDLSATGQK